MTIQQLPQIWQIKPFLLSLIFGQTIVQMKHSLPKFHSVKYCHKLCIQRQMVVRWKRVGYFLYGKYLKKNSFIENFVMQLKRQSVEAWQNEKRYSQKGIIPARNLKPVHHVKYEDQVRSQHLLFAQFSPWAFKLYKATITRCDLSVTILFKLVDSYLIAFKLAQ